MQAITEKSLTIFFGFLKVSNHYRFETSGSKLFKAIMNFNPVKLTMQTAQIRKHRRVTFCCCHSYCVRIESDAVL